MSTTRHLINRHRRAAAAAETRTALPTAVATAPKVRPARSKETPEVEPKEEATARPAGRRRALLLPLALGLVIVLLGGFAAFAARQAADARGAGDPNAALVDAALTSEVRGGVTDAVNAVFSVDYTDLGKNEAAAQKYLTGAAVAQHSTMLAEVRAQAVKQKLLLTSTVTDAGVELAQGNRARVLIFADQRNSRTDKDETSYGAAMLTVDAVRVEGVWKISNIKTFG